MDRELENLRRELARIERGRGRRYPAALRDRIARWTRARRNGGVSWDGIAGQLGIATESIRRWTMTGSPPQTALVPIEVVAEPPDIGGTDRELRLITRGGHCIEGLRIADVIELVRVLG